MSSSITADSSTRVDKKHLIRDMRIGYRRALTASTSEKEVEEARGLAWIETTQSRRGSQRGCGGPQTPVGSPDKTGEKKVK